MLPNQMSMLPGAVIGNSRMLATVFPNGNLTRLFWPNIDFPQHIGRSIAGIILHKPCKSEELIWVHDKSWEHDQFYMKNTNILVTEHWHQKLRLKIIQKDFIHPHLDILVRHFIIMNFSNKNQHISFLYYNHMTLNDMDRYNAAYYCNDNHGFIHYFKDTYFLVASDIAPHGYQCGKPQKEDDPMLFLYNGIPAGQAKISGNSATAGIWDIGLLKKEEEKEINIFFAAGKDIENVKETSTIIKKKSSLLEMLSHTCSFWKNHLSKSQPLVNTATVIEKTYKRSLLILKLLQDEKSGAFIAAPEFDPHYTCSGGYGYCWPRDSVFIALALSLAGYKDLAEQYYYFGVKTQRPDGLWSQRYYTTGQPAPGWGDQLDETGIMLWGIWQHYNLTQNIEFLSNTWPTVERGAVALTKKIDHISLPEPSMDLWEDTECRSTYTVGAVTAGLKAANTIARALKHTQSGHCWKHASEKVNNALHDYFWQDKKGYFIRGLINGTYDPTVDSAVLGLIFPFGILDPQGEKAKQVVNGVANNLYCKQIGGILRYQGDYYIGGNPWILITLWLSICFNLIGDKKNALQYFNWALKHRNKLDLLPEQVDKYLGKPIWALPLAWSHAMFILALFSLEGGIKVGL